MQARPDKPLSERMAGLANGGQRLDSMLKMPAAKSASNLAALQQADGRANPHLPKREGQQLLEAPTDAPKGRVPTKLSSSGQHAPLAMPTTSGMGATNASLSGLTGRPGAMPGAAPRPGMPAAPLASPVATPASSPIQGPIPGPTSSPTAASAAQASQAPGMPKPPQGTPLGKIDPVKVPADQAIPGTPPPAVPGAPVAPAIPGGGMPMPPMGGMPGMPGGPAKPEENIWKEIWGFLRAIFRRGDNEQRPAMSPFQAASNFLARRREGEPQAMQQGAIPGLFAAMDAPLHGLTPDDIQFASEVDAAMSRRPRFGIRVLSIAICVMFAVLIIWAALADVDEVTHAEGSVVGSQRTQTIQNLEGGILQELMVREGATVKKNELLAVIFNESAGSAYRDSENKALENLMAIIRLEAELKNEKPKLPSPEDWVISEWIRRQLKQAPSKDAIERAQQIRKDQLATWETRKVQLKAEIDVLKSQQEQRTREVQEQTARMAQLTRSLDIAIKQKDSAEILLKRNNFSRMEFLNLEQKVVDFQGQISQLEASIPKAEAAALEAEQRIASRQAEQQSAIYDEINKRRLELISLRETIMAGADRVTRTEVRSPVVGTVKQIHISTVGGVIKPGESIMDIVPDDETLLVEAKVLPKDRAFLRPGQDTMIKVTAYDFNIYGGLPGKLENISADTVEDKKGEFHYIVKVSTKQKALVYQGKNLPITPGMMVSADIMIGKKSILDYLVKPIMKAKQNALREK